MGTRFRALETPSNAAGPREPGAGQPRFALWRAWGRWRKWLALLSGSEARWGCGWLPEESFPLQNAAARSSFGAVGATGPQRCEAELAQGAWLGPGHRTSSRAQSCFPTKENPWGEGFGGRRHPVKQQGSGSQGQPYPALRYGEQRAGGENGLRCFPEPRRVGDVCCKRRLSLCRMLLPEARFGPSV